MNGKILRKISRVDIQVAILTALTALFSSVFVFVIGYTLTYNEMLQGLTDRVYSIYYYLDDVLDKETFHTLNTFEDQFADSYRVSKNLLENVKRATGVRYLYTAKRNADGQFVYLVDGLHSNASDFRYPGDPIEPEICPDMERALTDQVVLPTGIKNTDWGKIFITYFPIHEDEQVVGVLGIEFEAGRQYNVYTAQLFVVLLVALLASAVSTFIAYSGFRRISNPTFQDLANTDHLTGLKNRNAYEVDLHNMQATRELRGIGILSADLNNLKLVNDRLGHEQGDLYIQAAARALRACAGASDALYRIGGDEYVVILRNTTLEELDDFAKRLAEASDQFKVAGIKTSLSIGYALYNAGQDADLSALCRRADQEMYNRKHTFHQIHDQISSNRFESLHQQI